MAEHAADPGKRRAQHLLAGEVLELVHGREEATKTRDEHQALRMPSLASLGLRGTASESTTSSVQGATDRAVLPSSLVLDTPFSRILYHAGIVASKSEGARMIAKGGVYIATAATSSTTGTDEVKNDLHFVQLKNQKPEEVRQYVMDGTLVFRLGKWKVRVVKVVEDASFNREDLDAPGWSEWKASRPSI